MPQRQTLAQWLEAEPFRLVLSSGFFGFFAHTGVLTALHERGLLPRAVAGSSAGALVGGAWAAGVDPDGLAAELTSLRRQDFWDPGPGAGLLRGRLFRERLNRLLPVATFEQCRAPASLSIYDVLSGRTEALDRGPLAPAIHASCAVPFMFHPVWIRGRPVVDGGVVDRPGLAGVGFGERVLLHYLPSRSFWRLVNPPAPTRPNLLTLEIAGLPRVSPFRLDAGPRALAHARESTLVALDSPVDESGVRV